MRSLESYKSIGALILLCVSVGIGWWFLYPLANPPRPASDFLLPSAVFPSGWQATERYTHRINERFNYASDGAQQDYDYIGVGDSDTEKTVLPASHLVGTFGHLSVAQLEYQDLINLWFVEIDHQTEWEEPQTTIELQTVADEQQYGCAVTTYIGNEPHRICVVVSRYGQYVSVFWVLQDSQVMTETDFTTIMKNIDEQFQ